MKQSFGIFLLVVCYYTTSAMALTINKDSLIRIAEAVDMKEAVKEEMERRSPNCRIQLAEVRKNNGLLLHGISIYAPGSTMAPTSYIDG